MASRTGFLQLAEAAPLQAPRAKVSRSTTRPTGHVKLSAKSFYCAQNLDTFRRSAMVNSAIDRPLQRTHTILHHHPCIWEHYGSSRQQTQCDDTVHVTWHVAARPECRDNNRRLHHSISFGLARSTSRSSIPMSTWLPCTFSTESLTFSMTSMPSFSLDVFCPMLNHVPPVGENDEWHGKLDSGLHGRSIIKWCGHDCVKISQSWPNDITTRACPTNACVNAVCINLG